MAEKNKEIQKLIRGVLKEFGWSVPKFATKYLTDTSEHDASEDEYRSCVERVKKHLSRDSTKVEVLETYLTYLLKTSEFKSLEEAGKVKWLETETHILEDYQKLISSEDDPARKKVLEVASAYALSIGTAWDFHIVSIDADEFYEKRYIVLWDADVGFNHGSGSWGTAMCEVVESHFGYPFVRTSNHHFQTGMRCVKKVLGYNAGVLTLMGLNYGPNDPNNHPSVKCIVEMLECDSKWVIKDQRQIVL